MQTLAQRIIHWAAVQPAKLAVDDGTQAVTYKELARRAAAIADALKNNGVTSKDRVVLLLPKNVDAVSAIIAVLALGATYIPADPEAPKQRLESIVDDSQAKAIICSASTADSFNVPHIINIEDVAPLDNIERINALFVELQTLKTHSNTDAYILYTSGSTGVPNGVRISHRAMLSFFHAVNTYMGITQQSRCMNTSALYFDVSIADLLLPLYTGASVWLGPSVPLPFRFLGLLSNQKITHFCAVGSTLTMLSALPGFDKNNWPHLQTIMTGAEVLNPNTIDAWLSVSPNATVLNGYGPTETTCVCTLFQINHDTIQRYSSFPIGQPLPQVEAIIDCTDSDENIGELCIGGAQVMNGYLNRDHLNSARLTTIDNILYYRTGDKVRKDKNGDFIFLGRIDDQVKVNSYRVDLGDVAEPFRGLPNVQDAVALALKHEKFGECLAIVVKTRVDGNHLENLLNSAAASLPHYMRPVLIAEIDAMPLSPSGKVNAKKVRKLASEHFLNCVDPHTTMLTQLEEHAL